MDPPSGSPCWGKVFSSRNVHSKLRHLPFLTYLVNHWPYFRSNLSDLVGYFSVQLGVWPVSALDLETWTAPACFYGSNHWSSLIGNSQDVELSQIFGLGQIVELSQIA